MTSGRELSEVDFLLDSITVDCVRLSDGSVRASGLWDRMSNVSL